MQVINLLKQYVYLSLSSTAYYLAQPDMHSLFFSHFLL